MPFLNTDIPELKGFDTGLCLSNLDVLGARQNRISESILAVLSELCDAIMYDAENDPNTVDSILLSLQSFSDEDGDTVNIPHAVLGRVSPVNRNAVAKISAHSGLYARLLLYAMIEERMPTEAPNGKAASTLHQTARGRIAYMPAAFADKAYLRLSAHLTSPRATSTASFVDACEEVRDGLSEYCILPLESTHGGKLLAFTRLILRYHLRVVAACDLENGAVDGQITRFALLKAAVEGDFSVLHASSSEGDPLYLELIHVGAPPSLTDLLTAAEFCGMTIYRVDTLPRFDSPDGDTAPAFACILNATGGDLPTFRRFLTLEAADDILVGLYRIM